MMNFNLFYQVSQSTQMQDELTYYIKSQPEQIQKLCNAMVFEGESTRTLAERFNIAPKTVLRRVRKALAPIAVQYDISAARKYLRVSNVNLGAGNAGKLVTHRAVQRNQSSNTEINNKQRR